MPYTAAQLLSMSSQELDQLFGSSPAGDIPNGEAEGTAIIADRHGHDPLCDLVTSGAQRDTRILGNFARLLKRDGKPGYLAHVPRVWRQLEAQLRHPALAPVASWFDRHFPPHRRRTPKAA